MSVDTFWKGEVRVQGQIEDETKFSFHIETLMLCDMMMFFHQPRLYSMQLQA